MKKMMERWAVQNQLIFEKKILYTDNYTSSNPHRLAQKIFPRAISYKVKI